MKEILNRYNELHSAVIEIEKQIVGLIRTLRTSFSSTHSFRFRLRFRQPNFCFRFRQISDEIRCMLRSFYTFVKNSNYGENQA